ncbi:tRNA pseudouridine synthase A [halophilic archaeon DL31]|jgi:tRNA pseudouridine38-40 synthase|nr:tRNA pseudouridine synthase A [halophilic archaeon DL31]
MRAYRLAYDGRPYYGYQRQPDVPTVEDTLFAGLEAIGVLEDADQKPPNYAAAGRTDAGVSAVAQTVAFDAPEWCTPGAVNAELPGSVRAWAAAAVDGDFHPTRDPVQRTYVYHLHAPDADDSAASAAASALSGKHDYHNFTSDDHRTVREVSATVERDGEFLAVEVSAGGFPRGFVRRFIGVLFEIAVEGAPLSRAEEALGEESLQGGRGIPRLSPEPLVLTGVAYPNLEFTVDEQAATSAREVFEERRVGGLERARVASSVLSGLSSPN